MQKKHLALLAVAAIGVLLYLRKKEAAAEIASTAATAATATKVE